MKFLLGTKGAMKTHYRDDGTAFAATEVHAGPCQVTQVKVHDTSGTNAVQIGFGTTKHLRKPQLGHLKGLPSFRVLREFSVEKPDAYTKGQELTVAQFIPGDKVRVSGISKGHGFQGVVKRHGFHGSPASHGHKDQLRMPGSIGAGGVQRVFKGMRMGGRMGTDRVTLRNMEILAVDAERGVLVVKGAVPGPRGGLIELAAPGEAPAAVTEATKPEATKTPATGEAAAEKKTLEKTA
jgi:large subunit ribosomal protein L3